MRTGRLKPEKILTQAQPIRSVIKACQAFDRREAGWLKVKLGPQSMRFAA